MTAPAVTRALTISYGTFDAGGATVYHLHGPVRVERETFEARVSFQIVVQEDSDAAFLASCAAVEAAFALRDQRIKVLLNAQTHHDFNPATNTGFNTTASCVKAGGAGDTANSRVYAVTCSAQLP